MVRRCAKSFASTSRVFRLGRLLSPIYLQFLRCALKLLVCTVVLRLKLQISHSRLSLSFNWMHLSSELIDRRFTYALFL